MAAASRVRQIEFLTWDGCPSSGEAREVLDGVLDFFDIPAEVTVVEVTTQEDAEQLRFPGSPTIRIDGQDVDPAGADARPSLSCRVYRRPNGSVSPLPSEFQIQSALKMHIPLGSPAPDFALRGVDGSIHRLADYDERSVLVLIQSCNHCPYVQGWEDRINAIARDYAPQGVAVVAICSNDPDAFPEDDFDAMVERARDKSFAFDYLHDVEQTLVRALGATRTPEVFVFDAKRALVYHGAVDDSRDDPAAVSQPYLRDAIEAALAGTTPEVADTPPLGCFVKWRPRAA